MEFKWRIPDKDLLYSTRLKFRAEEVRVKEETSFHEVIPEEDGGAWNLNQVQSTYLAQAISMLTDILPQDVCIGNLVLK